MGENLKNVDVNKNYYSVLGLTSQATSKEIQTAFRSLAKVTHPDLNKSPDAAERFKDLQDKSGHYFCCGTVFDGRGISYNQVCVAI